MFTFFKSTFLCLLTSGMLLMFFQSTMFQSVVGQTVNTMTAKGLNQLAWDSLNSNLTAAQHYAERAFSQAKTEGNYIEMAKSINRMGLVHERRSELISALDKYHEGLELRRYKDTKSGIANNFLLIGNIYRKQMKFPISIAYYDSCRDYAASDGNHYLQAKAFNNMALVYKKQNMHNKARDYLMAALNLIKHIATEDNLKSDGTGLRSFSNSALNLGVLFAQTDQPDSAQFYWDIALNIQRQMNDQNGMARTYNNLASLHYNYKTADSALFFYDKSLGIKREITDYNGMVTTLYNIAIILTDQRRFQEALPILDTAKAICLDHKLMEPLSDVIWQYVEIYMDQGQKDLALTHIKKHVHLSDSLSQYIFDQKIAEEEVRFDTKTKEYQNKKLILEAKINRQHINWMILVISGLAGVLLLLLLMLRFYVLKRKKEEIITQQKIDQLIKEQEVKSLNAMMEGQEKERERIAADLHDRLGSMLSTIKMYFSSLNEKVDDVKAQNKEQYEKADHLLNDAIQEVRKISQNMVSGVLINFGLISALSDLADTIEGSERIKVKLIGHNMEGRLDNNTEISIYRIIQELLSNVLKHAKASHVTVQLNRYDGSLNLMVEDDGIGFEPWKIEANKGMGIENVKSRVQKLHGNFHIDSRPGQGTTVDITDLKV